VDRRAHHLLGRSVQSPFPSRKKSMSVYDARSKTSPLGDSVHPSKTSTHRRGDERAGLVWTADCESRRSCQGPCETLSDYRSRPRSYWQSIIARPCPRPSWPGTELPLTVCKFRGCVHWVFHWTKAVARADMETWSSCESSLCVVDYGV
jgi:hypothetical protein